MINRELPQNRWNINFREQEDSTLVVIDLAFESLEDLEKIVEMGFKEGFASALENLDRYFDSQD